jgi:serine-type D-Ala-D-Ala carboxypeptidase (penicillin-binding protein 5/6)
VDLRCFTAVMAFCTILLAASTGGIAQDIVPYETSAPEAILIDANSGAVFFEKNADELIPPASMSKLMTLTLVMEALKAGKLKLDQEVLVSEDAWRRGGSSSGGSTMYAEINSRVKVVDLMHGAMIQSANDACIALAEALAGSESAFAQRMTERGRELGLQKATFRNSTGLPDPEHLMSVRDLTILARHIINDFPEYYKFYSEPEFTWNNITQQNRNPLLKDYPGADGVKTGYTKESGYGLVGSAVRDGRRLLMVITGLKSINERKEEAQKLLDWGFRQFKPIDVYAAGETVSKARVWGGKERWVNLVTKKDVRLALSQAEQDKIEVKLNYSGPLMAPVKPGQPVGIVRFMIDGKAVAEVPVETASAVDAEDSMWSKSLDSIAIMVFGG